MTEGRGIVLAVDDDPGALSALADALGTLGFQVVQAADGETALELAKQKQPDVVLLDVQMPGMDGFEVCRRLKADPTLLLVPVVFLTGHGSRRARLEGLEAGATDFLNKPCDLVELEVRVRNLVNFRRLTTELDSAEQMVYSIARVVEARDQDTGDHCERLASLSVALGERLGLDGEAITALRRGGYLHDLGKIGIPDEVLLKPGKLTADEWTVMKRHVEIGVEICSPLHSLKPVLPLIRHHHERFDGSGYPDGLSGEDIPLLARVFQVVDVYDALTVDRCYRSAMTVDEAVAVVRDETDKGYWDPAIVGEFLAMLDEGVDVSAS
ncbi:MAG: HD domain-containing phosphohydrolase [Thermoanaerobaculales bacterium]|jgi:putative two-component system response regulator|nr:HD domain-containing phosphohydrolase [Thermoanaerobaculales bacterium]